MQMARLTGEQIALLNRMSPAASRVGLGTMLDDALATETNEIADLAVTNAKLANDVKVGSLAALTTSVKSSVVAALNGLVADLAAETEGSSGADMVGITPITALGEADTVQEALEALIAVLTAETAGASGADFVGVTTIANTTGNTVQAVLEDLADRVYSLEHPT